ncbi:hypothetical protein [Nocardioides mangrovi]|uniref:Uncharacterized protein n=1 Tax=Nocardioides mangrovi TaxID=2874580 RepID=A0ABS7UD09_9ACTN|nr:hypothetical protein [Nocardioides mangrovi]MBZ5738734.1 hypothetical protein [Nocardioides mangrovi]
MSDLGVRTPTPSETRRARQNRVTWIVVAAVVALVAAYVVVELLLARSYDSATKKAATSTAQIMAPVMADLEPSLDGESMDTSYDLAQKAYQQQAAEPGAPEVPDYMDVGLFHGRSVDDPTVWSTFACALNPRQANLPGLDAPEKWCVPLDDPDAEPIRVREGGLFFVLNH